jgi:hypothetical protein
MGLNSQLRLRHEPRRKRPFLNRGKFDGKAGSVRKVNLPIHRDAVKTVRGSSPLIEPEDFLAVMVWKSKTRENYPIRKHQVVAL